MSLWFAYFQSVAIHLASWNPHYRENPFSFHLQHSWNGVKRRETQRERMREYIQSQMPHGPNLPSTPTSLPTTLSKRLFAWAIHTNSIWDSQWNGHMNQGIAELKIKYMDHLQKGTLVDNITLLAKGWWPRLKVSLDVSRMFWSYLKTVGMC